MPVNGCTICRHPKRAAAEKALAQGEPGRAVAKRLGLSYASLERHGRNCIRKALKKAAEKREAALADRLLDEMESLHATTRDILHDAREGRTIKVKRAGIKEPVEVHVPPDGTVALRAIGQARKNVELVARLAGKLEPEQQVQKGVTFEEFEAIYLRRTTVQQ